MTYQYMIWRSARGELHHLAFNQNSKRIVYPPSHSFYRKPVAMAIMFYEQRGWELIDQGAWRGDKVNEYLQAMQKLHSETLQEDTSTKAKKADVSEKDSPQDGLPDDGDSVA